MEFEAIILEHMGKDIYIGVENAKEHKRQEVIVQNYQVLSLERGAYEGSGTGLICSKEQDNDGIQLELKARIEKGSRLFDMIDIEARYQKYFYHIYIMNCINIANNCLFAKRQEEA